MHSIVTYYEHSRHFMRHTQLPTGTPTAAATASRARMTPPAATAPAIAASIAAGRFWDVWTIDLAAALDMKLSPTIFEELVCASSSVIDTVAPSAHSVLHKVRMPGLLQPVLHKIAGCWCAGLACAIVVA